MAEIEAAGEEEQRANETATEVHSSSIVDDRDEKKKSMTPWEQHSCVISIPRFDYNAPFSLLCNSHSGFLITCTIKREKSATKEALSILEKYVGSFANGRSEILEKLDDNGISKRRKICMDNLDRERINNGERNTASNNSGDNSSNCKPSKGICSSPARVDINLEEGPILSLVKLTRSGLLLFTFPRNSAADTVSTVSNIMDSFESGTSKSPLWCHRIFPIQATCTLNEKELQAVVSKLVLQFLNDKQQELARPVKFAVGYNTRGIKETEMKILKDTSNGSNAFALLDRNKCFSVVAAAVKDAASDSVVDLKSPVLSVLVELLPLSGVPNGELVVAVSVLPRKLVNTKPRLCIKALVSAVKVRDDGRD
ncbi:hypothetical protein F2P56_030349 [Juglans regia]|uniref:THUMP domain-containing protein n=2 Tax=Juglans regia TaxID=51240 RepID=A0A833SZH8_JUGRE|nr:uncharacterized protein LOC108997103 isoform X2 [Juglans regia]KAF5449956.1 hypothetical protein F2P56_030349 [Juglans regia]